MRANNPQKILHVGGPNIGNRERFLELVNGILDRRWFSNNGPVLNEFEQHAANFLGVRNAIGICNATAGLEIVCRALGLTGEVIVPSFTFVASAHALQWQQLTPVFCDIDPATHNIDPRKIEAHISPRTSGIMGVHLWGRACNVAEISAIASKYNLKVVFDASHAFGCTSQGTPVGSFGDCEVFSFHATKFLNSLEGGMVVTNDDSLARKIRMMCNFGFTGYDRVEQLGINGKMNEISAAMGLSNLEVIDDIIAINRHNYGTYRHHLEALPGISLLEYDPKDKYNYQYIVLEVDENACPAGRDALMHALHARGVIARKYFWPGCHRMEPYRTLYPAAAHHLRETEALSEKILVLPTGQTVGEADISRICRTIRETIES